MSKHVRIITPHVTPAPKKLLEVEDLIGLADLEFTQVNIETGPISIESEFDDVLCAPGVLARALQAEEDGAHAIIIDCFGDPALHAAREIVSIPVLGPGETTMRVATLLGHRFSVVTVLDSVVSILENHAKIYGVHDQLASIRVINTPVRSISHDINEVATKLTEQAVLAIRQDRADVIILGCTGFLGVSEVIESNLKKEGLPVPVINPLRTSVMAAVMMLQLGLSHSPLSYQPPSRKPITGYTMPSLAKKSVNRDRL